MDAEGGLPPWTRSREGRILAGVCAGFADRLGTSPWIVRAILIFATLVTAGLGAVVYLILALTLPLEPEIDEEEPEDEAIDG